MGVFIPWTAWAQASERDPLNTQTAVRPPVYQSAFLDYKPYQEPQLIPWKMANDVVLEFGGMAAMGSMNDGKNPDPADTKTGGDEQTDPSAKPAHDMTHTRTETPAAVPKNAAPPDSKPAKMKTMPGHDMSRMPQKAPATAPKPSPETLPGHRGMTH